MSASSAGFGSRILGWGTYGVGSVGRLHALALEQEADAGEGLALALAEGEHELLELCVALDLEEDLVIIVRDLDVEVLRGGGRVTTGAAGVLVRRLGCVGHCGCGRVVIWAAEMVSDEVRRSPSKRQGGLARSRMPVGRLDDAGSTAALGTHEWR